MKSSRSQLGLGFTDLIVTPVITPELERDRALASVEHNAPWNPKKAADFVVAWLAENGAHSAEDITDAAKAAGHIPHNDRAFGALYRRLKNANRIHAVGYNDRRRKGHAARGGFIWAAGATT